MPAQNAINKVNMVSVNVSDTTGAGSFSYTPPANLLYAIVYIRGAGGAGGGSSTGATIARFSAGSGGGGGAYAIGVFSRAQLLPSVSLTVGAGGTGVVGADGNNGGNTTFGSLLTANGGAGGKYLLGAATVQVLEGGAGGTFSGAGATGANGTAGAIALMGTTGGLDIAARGIGGTSFISGGLFTNFSIPGAGTPAQDAGPPGFGQGGGGTGAFTVNAGADRAGGNGAAGGFNIIEFLSAP